MLLTPPQVKRFWREWSACTRLHHWPTDEVQPQRKALLARAGFTSLTLVDPHAGYTAVLKQLATLQDNLTGMLSADENPKRVLLHTISELAAQLGQPYAEKLLRDKHGHTRLTDLTEAELIKHRYTLTARLASHGRSAQDPAPSALVPALEYAKENAPF